MQASQFTFEPAGRRPLLLASIAAAHSSESSKSAAPGGLRLPPLPEGLRASVKHLTRRGPREQRPPQQRRARLPHPPDLRQLQAVAAAAGGVLIAAVSQVAQRVAAVRPAGQQTLPFHQSFKLPWNVGARSGSRRWVQAVQRGAYRQVLARGRPPRLNGRGLAASCRPPDCRSHCPEP